jgi:hypothetical protein
MTGEDRMTIDTFEHQVRERVEALLGGAAQDTITGATSVRCAAGLVVGTLDGLTTLNEESAWSYLDRHNRKLVLALRAAYADRLHGWSPMPHRESRLIANRQRQAAVGQCLLAAIRFSPPCGALSESAQEALEELRDLLREERDLDPASFRTEADAGEVAA